jgi:hypothetical protein
VRFFLFSRGHIRTRLRGLLNDRGEVTEYAPRGERVFDLCHAGVCLGPLCPMYSGAKPHLAQLKSRILLVSLCAQRA